MCVCVCVYWPHGPLLSPAVSHYLVPKHPPVPVFFPTELISLPPLLLLLVFLWPRSAASGQNSGQERTVQVQDREMSPKDLQPKCKTGGNKRLPADGRRGRNEGLLAGGTGSARSTSVQTLLTLVGTTEKTRELKVDEEVISVNIDTSDGWLRRRLEDVTFPRDAVGSGGRSRGSRNCPTAQPLRNMPARLFRAPLALLISVDNVLLCQLQEGCA